jgi:homoserine kinase
MTVPFMTAPFMAWDYRPGGAVRVRVPATSANLGPGFDALGLALTLHDDVTAWVTPSGLDIRVTGEGDPDLAEAGEKHLVVQAMRAAFDEFAAKQPPGLALRCVNRIPHGRGLGSSAAAIVAGLLAAHGLAAQQDLGVPDLLALATRIEGHPDNVAACLGGGLTIAWAAPDGPRMVRLDPLPGITPVVCIAEDAVRTDVARDALPDEVPHRDAAANAGRSALLVAALTQDPAVLFDATRDWLHQDYRAAAMPDAHALVQALRAAGLPAVISGAGPSVLVLLGPDSGYHLDSLGSIVRETGKAWRISSLNVERQGGWLARTGVGEPSGTPLPHDTDGCEGMP